MSVYLICAFTSFLFLAIIWGKDGWKNVVIKVILILMTIWTALLVFKLTNTVHWLTQGL